MTTVLIVIFAVMITVVLAVIYGKKDSENDANKKITDRVLKANRIKKEIDNLDSNEQRDRLRKYSE